MKPIHGQWTRNDLLLQFKSELECYHLIDGDYAKDFRKCYQLQQERLRRDYETNKI